MYPFLLTLHLLVCLCLVAVVLVQSGKGGGLAGGAFGGATQTVFGGRGATDFITRATVVLGVLFFLTSLSLALLTTRGTTTAHSVVSEAAKRAASSAPPTLPSQSVPPGGIQTTPLQKGPAPSTPPQQKAPAPSTPPPASGNKK